METKYSLEFVVKLLKEHTLIAPYHIELERSGDGEFPDSYILTDVGAERLLNELKEKLK